MKQIRTILYATDFSEISVPACDYALTLARLAGARVHVLHVVAELTFKQRSLMQPEIYAAFEREVELDAVKEMTLFCGEKFKEEIAYTTEVVIGTPFEAILKKSAEIEADLIVMGTHGRTGIDHVIVGSTAERVVRMSTVPVLTVRTES